MTYDLAHEPDAPTIRASRAYAPTSRILSSALADDAMPIPVALLAAALCLAVGLVHLQDQGGFIGSVTPEWMAVGYYAVEILAALTIPFLIRQKVAGWVLGVAVSAGPFVGYVLSRTVGLPGDPGDVGNWNYTLGTVSLIVEGLLFVISVSALLRAASSMTGEGGAKAKTKRLAEPG